MTKRRITMLLTLALALTTLGASQNEAVRVAAANAVATVGRGLGLKQAIHRTALVTVVARHADGTEFYRHTSHNLTTNAGFDLISKAVSDTAAQPAACNYIGVTNTAVTPNIADTTLSGEIAVNGLTRAQAVFAHTTGQLTYTLTKVFTATGTQASQATAVFNASSSGSMCFENTYTGVTVNNTDTLTITWTVTLS